LGLEAITDALEDYFVNSFVRNGLVEIAPEKLNATWRNRRAGEDRVVKRLDRFLVEKSVVDFMHFIPQWVECGGISDHSLIMLEVKGGISKPPYPFKFNSGWLLDEGYINLVSS